MEYEVQVPGEVLEARDNEIWAPVHCDTCPSTEGIFISTAGRIAKLYSGPSPYSGKGEAVLVGLKTELNVKRNWKDISVIAKLSVGIRKMSLLNIYRNAFIKFTGIKDKVPSTQVMKSINLKEATPMGILPLYKQYDIYDESMWNNRNDTSRHKILSAVPGRPVQPLSKEQQNLIVGECDFCTTYDGEYVDGSGLYWRPLIRNEISPLQGYWISAVGDVVKLDRPLNLPSADNPLQRELNCRIIKGHGSTSHNVSLRRSSGDYRTYHIRKLVYNAFLDSSYEGLVKCIFKKAESCATHLIVKC